MNAGVGLPGAVLALLYVGLASLPMLVAHLTGIEPLRPVGEFATALGLTTAAFLHLQFLSSGRYERLSGRIGIDRTMGFHRLAAGTLLVFAILHPLGYATASASGDPAMAWNRLLNLLMSARLRTGVLALAGLFVIVVLAVLRTRPWVRYELWRVSHGPLAVVVTALSLHHAVVNGTYTAEMPLRLIWAVLALMAGTAVLIAYVFRPLAHVARGLGHRSGQPYRGANRRDDPPRPCRHGTALSCRPVHLAEHRAESPAVS